MLSLWTLGHLIYPSSWRKRVQFYSRALWHKTEIESMREVFSSWGVAPLLATNPRIYEKPLYPYMIHPMGSNDRFEALYAHYRFVGKKFKPELIDHLSAGFVLIGRICEQEMPFDIRLDRIRHFANEGEMTLGLYGPKGERYYVLSFNFDDRDGGKILIGSLQGTSDIEGEDAKEIIKNVTKALHGLRPQIALVTILQIVGRLLEIPSMWGVRTQAHVYNASSRIKRIKTDYDFFWNEAGGLCENETLYALPMTYERKSLEEIKSNKRSMYKKRYAMLDDLETQIEENLGSLIVTRTF